MKIVFICLKKKRALCGQNCICCSNGGTIGGKQMKVHIRDLTVSYMCGNNYNLVSFICVHFRFEPLKTG